MGVSKTVCQYNILGSEFLKHLEGPSFSGLSPEFLRSSFSRHPLNLHFSHLFGHFTGTNL